MAVKTLLKAEYDLYNQLIIISKQKTVFQTIPYLESLVKLGYSFEILGYFVLGELKYALPVQKKKIPFVNRFYYAIPYGIISEEESIDRDILNGFIKILKQKGWIINLSLQEKLEIPKFTHQAYHTTLMIDLNETIDSIFNSFSKTHRNCTRKALKEGVTVRMSRDLNDIALFIHLYESMLDEKSFDGIKPSLVRDIMSKLIESNLGFFAIACFEGKVYNMAFISTIGTNARYLYGSSLRTQDKLPPIGQYLHYEIIRYLKEEDYKSYDMGGIPNLPIDDYHQSYHVYKFKKGFGGIPKILSYDYKYVRFKLLRLLNR